MISQVNKFLKSIVLPSVISSLLACLPLASHADIVDKGEIRFQRGAQSGTYSGALIRGDTDRYSLVAAAGQQMQVEITSVENNAVFRLSVYSYGTGQDVPLEGAAEGDDATSWSGRLPDPGYSKDGEQNLVDILVSGTRGNATYELTITLPPKSAGRSQEPGSVNGKYSGLLQTLYCPQDKAQYGEFNEYGYWEGGPWCGETGLAGYWVWKPPYWYVWASRKP